jgi:hypothetical protein
VGILPLASPPAIDNAGDESAHFPNGMRRERVWRVRGEAELCAAWRRIRTITRAYLENVGSQFLPLRQIILCLLMNLRFYKKNPRNSLPAASPLRSHVNIRSPRSSAWQPVQCNGLRRANGVKRFRLWVGNQFDSFRFCPGRCEAR